MKTYVYIAGPYTKPDPAVNTHNAIQLGNQLLDLGFVPFIPHLTHFWHLLIPRAYEEWLALDIDWLKRCDALLRFPGESSGADGEVTVANELGIPVFYSIEELQRHFQGQTA